MTPKRIIISAAAGIVLLLALLIVPGISSSNTTSGQSSQKPSQSELIMSAIKLHFSDNNIAYTLNSITSTTEVGDNYVYILADASDQMTTTIQIPFLFLRHSDTYYELILGVGNDFTNDEMSEKHIPGATISKVVELYTRDAGGESEDAS